MFRSYLPGPMLDLLAVSVWSFKSGHDRSTVELKNCRSAGLRATVLISAVV